MLLGSFLQNLLIEQVYYSYFAALINLIFSYW
jgi:hypothetical protein